MADRFAEPDDAAVDELKRKARRRLVGAIVLALAAAVIVPMLLEREPRPLGDEVSVQIPPVDEGKFVNRLNDGKSGAAKKEEPASNAASPGAAPATKSISEAEQRVLAPPSQAAATPPPAPVAATEPKNAPAPETKPAQPAERTKTDAAKSEPTKAEPAGASSATSLSAPSAASSSSSMQGFVVQLAAYADDKGANALAGKLKRAGYPAYTEPVHTTRGTLWRVRVGSYPSRDAASDARNKLKSDGYNGIVAAAK